jgi:hypothetical protein
MKHYRKIICLFTVIILSLTALSGCGGQSGGDNWIPLETEAQSNDQGGRPERPEGFPEMPEGFPEGRGDFPGGMGGMTDLGIDRELMQQAMEIIMAAGGEITDEARGALTELGLTEEQIEMLSEIQENFPQGGQGGRGGFQGGQGMPEGGPPDGRTPPDNQPGEVT